jgi:hypothetical protein
MLHERNPHILWDMKLNLLKPRLLQALLPAMVISLDTFRAIHEHGYRVAAYWPPVRPLWLAVRRDRQPV